MATEQSNPSQCGGKEMLGVMLKQVCTAASGMALAILLGGVATTAQQKTAAGQPGIDMQGGVKVPARDGVKLKATGFTLHRLKEPVPVIFQFFRDHGVSYTERDG